jgi:hypothetical protein
MLKKILALVAVLFMCCGGASAITPEEIHEQIQYAVEIVRQAELRLKRLAPRLTDIWITERTNDEGHAAEVELRRLYPKEYMEYIVARSNLDDLLYTQYLMFANGKAE